MYTIYNPIYNIAILNRDQRWAEFKGVEMVERGVFGRMVGCSSVGMFYVNFQRNFRHLFTIVINFNDSRKGILISTRLRINHEWPASQPVSRRRRCWLCYPQLPSISATTPRRHPPDPKSTSVFSLFHSAEQQPKKKGERSTLGQS